MKSVHPPGANLTLVADGCNSVRAIITADPPTIITHWELTDEELWHVIDNRRIVLTTYGHNFPPVRLDSHPP